MILMYPYFIALVIYLLIKVHMLYIYSHYLMKLHEFFFFLQAHAEFFFSSISCMNFFLDLTPPPPPRISNGPPLRPLYKWAVKGEINTTGTSALR